MLSKKWQSDDGRGKWITLVILSLSLLVVVMDATIVNVALPSIQKEFTTTLRDLEWITSIYALVFAAFIITWGRIGDDIGRRKIFIAGIVVFIVGSAITGFSSGIPVMLVGRAIQGFGAAMLSPSTLSILSTTFTGRMRGVAFGLWGATAGAAASLGPLIGGFLATYATWRWAFLINLPIGIFTIIGAILFIHETSETRHKHRRDNIGVVLAAVGFAALVFGLIEGQGYGWIRPKQVFSIGKLEWPFQGIAITPVMFFLAAISLTAFVIYEQNLLKRRGEPLFDFRLLTHRGFRFGLMTASIVALGEFGIIFIFSIYLQIVRSQTAFQTGLMFLPFSIAIFIVAPIAGTLSSRIGPKWVVTSGMLCEALAIFVFSLVLSVTVSLWVLVPVLIVYGSGVGLAIAQLTNVTLSDVPPKNAGAASGAINTMRQVGAAIGVAILGAVLSFQIASTGNRELQVNTMIPAFAKTPLAQSLDNGLSGDTSQYSDLQANSPVAQAIKGIVDDAITHGTTSAARAAAGFVLLGAFSSLWIPNVKAPRGRHAEMPGAPPSGE